MRVFALFFVLVAASLAFEVEVTDVSNENLIEPYLFEDKITTFLECVRDILKNGDEPSGLPILDPFTVDAIYLDLDALQLQGLSGHINSTNLRSNGVSDWSVDKLKIGVTIFPPGMKAQVDVNWPSTFSSGSYDIDANIFGHVIKGAGDFRSEFKNFRITFDGKAIVRPISIKSAKLKVLLDDTDVQLGTLTVDDVDLADLIRHYGNNLPQILKDVEKPLNKVLVEYVIPAVNEIIQLFLGKGDGSTKIDLPIIGKCLAKHY